MIHFSQEMIDDRVFPGENVGYNTGFQTQVAKYYHYTLPNRKATMIDPKMVWEAVQELYELTKGQSTVQSFINHTPTT